MYTMAPPGSTYFMMDEIKTKHFKDSGMAKQEGG